MRPLGAPTTNKGLLTKKIKESRTLAACAGGRDFVEVAMGGIIVMSDAILQAGKDKDN